jgi:succinyl-diaminopimelate desuccinylase
MVSIPSSNPHVSGGDEKEVAKFLREELEDAGLQVCFQNVTSKPYWTFAIGRSHTRPNVIARVGNKDGIKLILNGHIDTVTGQTMKHAFDPKIVGDKLYGRGSSDMKGGIAAIVAATEAVQECSHSLHGELVLSFVVDEETSGRGTINFLSKEHGDFAIVAEPTENTLGIAQAGFIDFNIFSKGESRHGQTAVPKFWANAFVSATNVCNRILEDGSLIRKKTCHGLDMSSTYNFSPTKYKELSSGAWMTLDEFRVNCLLGLVPESTPAKSTKKAKMALSRIKKLVSSDDANGRRNRFELVDMKIGFIQSENAYTRTFDRAMDGILGHHQHSYVLSYCDASYFYNAGIPTILFGPGKMDVAHSSQEYTSISQVKDATSVFAHAIEDILENSTKKINS